MAKDNLRNFRVATPKWELALKVAEREGTTVSGVLTAALDKFLKKHATDEELAGLDNPVPTADTAAV